MSRKEARRGEEPVQLPLKGHELYVLRQRLNPVGVFVPENVYLIYKRIKRKVLYERQK